MKEQIKKIKDVFIRLKNFLIPKKEDDGETRLVKVGNLILIIFFMWASTTGMIQRYKCPKMTETEIALAFKNWVFFNWEECK